MSFFLSAKFFNRIAEKKSFSGLILILLSYLFLVLTVGCAESNYGEINGKSRNWRGNFKNLEEAQDQFENSPPEDDDLEPDFEDERAEHKPEAGNQAQPSSDSESDSDSDSDADSESTADLGSLVDSDLQPGFDSDAGEVVAGTGVKENREERKKREVTQIEELFKTRHQNINANEYFHNYNEVLKSHIISITLKEIISNNGKSKKYKDLLSLDGGTVGIAHFASGGLADLYRHMDTNRYFGYDRKTMIDKFSSRCKTLDSRARNKGCYEMSFWQNGMKRFLNSSESERVQNVAFFARNRRLIESVLAKGWNYSYEIMIAISIANSLGFNGFHKLAAKYHWDAHQVLKRYSKLSAHKNRRAMLITSYLNKTKADNVIGPSKKTPKHMTGNASEQF